MDLRLETEQEGKAEEERKSEFEDTLKLIYDDVYTRLQSQITQVKCKQYEYFNSNQSNERSHSKNRRNFSSKASVAERTHLW
mmetsp:Transcript_38314/g.36666  ORF Transcript_38314/g.36666 Transcript_38314/m.36666 type:complete len:82 (+) Transcript_38314:834-1079(+)